ncbi:anion transporter [Sporomusaceae bacterium BoRhaA]|uniref:SLC13 family permease n=1 Tax=Pelorhabdus rhamnosifermentans TaxID=2772457 RepID=UPI001C06084D|nr:DASS family sodium-coupled anion symporter [Pelorhabdus rhamnosifermentans]MBU2699773.1 anion transporter [Pelorhabdus rhamnosifermentans]
MADKKSSAPGKILWIIIGLVIMLGLAFAPAIPGLSTAGQRVLAVLLFAVIMWVSEAVSYPVSAIAIIGFLIMFVGFAPVKGNEGALLGTGKAIPLALSGFINSGWVLVAAGLFMAACILHTGLEKRIALTIINMVGTKTNNIFAGMIMVTLVLTFLIPSITARSATLTPIAMGLIAAFNVDKRSVFARQLLICVAIITSISGIGVLSGGAPNPVAAAFVANSLKTTISWGQWFLYSEPFCLVFSLAFYFIITRVNKFEFDEVPGGKAALSKALHDLGSMSDKEKKISVIFVFTILGWATESFHHVDANTVAIFSVLFMLAPYTGIATFKDVVNKVDWGTILLFGAGISLGEMLLSSGAAVWLAKVSLGALGVGNMPLSLMIIVITACILILRLAFASITAATAAVVPTVVGFLLSLNNPSLPMVGMTMLSTYAVYYAFFLPVNSPQAMIAYATDTFETKDMIRIGIPTTIVGLIIFFVFVFTYWQWVGML